MADFMISYASTDADLARQIARSLQAAGYTFWMDDASTAEDTRQLVGLPGGQAHWTVISTAMDEAATILIVETPAWHAREYCRKELDHARRHGKRLAVVLGPTQTASALPEAVVAVPPDEVDALVVSLRPGNGLARAHARLLRDMAAPRRRLSRADREQVQDAEQIATTALSPLGLNVDAELAAYCQDVLRRARTRGRARNGIAVGVVVALVAAATVALVSSHAAQVGEANAKEQADFAQALLLAQQAEQETTTATALALAQRAVALHDSAATRATMTRIMATASYVRTTSTPSGISTQAAISRDGTTVLASRANAVLVVTPGDGTVRSVAAPTPLGRRLAITPDGSHGVALSRSGSLVCLDIRAASATVDAETHNVVDLQVTADSTLWWVTRDGALHRATSCAEATDASTVVATGLSGADAVGINAAATIAVTVTTDNRVLGYRLPGGGGADAPSTPLWTVDLASLPGEAGPADTGAHDPRALPSVQFCGEVAHVLTGVKYTSLPTSTHVALALDGKPVGKRTSNVLMVGVGCGPDHTAWASPAITPAAIALPGTAAYPVGMVDTRDRGTQNVIANSADGSHTVLAHGDGRIQVLYNAATPWGIDVGKAAIAVPMPDGVVTADQDGTVRLRHGSIVTSIGTLAGPPVPATVALPDRAIVASGRRVLAINAHGISQLGEAPATVTTLAASLGGDRIIVGTDVGWLALGTNGGGVTPLTVPKLDNEDQVFGVQLDGDRALWNTHHGRLFITDLDGTVRHSIDLGAAGGNVATFNAAHSVVAMGSDGLLRQYTASLEPIHTTLFGSGALSIHPTPDARVAVLGLNDFSVWMVDLSSLQALGQMQYRSPDVRLVVPSADGTTVIRLATGGSGDSYHAKLEVLTTPKPLR